jgi:hypothetical protein
VTLADVLAVVSGLAIGGAGFACLSIILSTLMPGAIARAGARASGRAGRCAALGLFLFLASTVLWGTLLKIPSPLARLAAILTILAGLSMAVLGGAALAAELGRRSRGAGGALALRNDVLRGVLLLEGAALLPIVGWFVVLPAAFFVSLGAGFHAALRRRAPEAAIPAPVPQA